MNVFLVLLRVIADFTWVVLGVMMFYKWTDVWTVVPIVVGYIIVVVYTELLARSEGFNG